MLTNLIPMQLKNVFPFLIVFLVISCNTSINNKETKITKNQEVVSVEDIKNIEVDIEGMTCEIGCARLIQSKLYKTDGVTFADISFENKLGKISFDVNKVSVDEIKEEIQKIAGGDLYKVVKSREVESFSSTN